MSVSSKGFINIQAITEFSFNRNADLIWQKYIVWDIHYDFFFFFFLIIANYYGVNSVAPITKVNLQRLNVPQCRADILICYKESQLPSFCRFVDVTISIDEIWQKSCLLHYVRFKALVHDKEWHLVQKRSSDKYNKMVKDTHTIRR